VNEVILLARAEAHFHREYAQLAETDFARAEHFDAVINEGLRQLREYPHSGPPFEGQLRRLFVGGYALGIYYAVEGRRIVVHGLLDTRRDPEWIRRELGLDP
jgi:plasmid stabilization system protein ParE